MLKVKPILYMLGKGCISVLQTAIFLLILQKSPTPLPCSLSVLFYKSPRAVFLLLYIVYRTRSAVSRYILQDAPCSIPLYFTGRPLQYSAIFYRTPLQYSAIFYRTPPTVFLHILQDASCSIQLNFIGRLLQYSALFYRTPPAVFREKVHGSVQMVQRFKLQYKMEYHEGCVNALHFNRIGRFQGWIQCHVQQDR